MLNSLQSSMDPARPTPWHGKAALLFELSRGGKGENLRAMEGMRGLAVILVFFVHYVSLCDPWTPKETLTATIAPALHAIGRTGVDLFFILSGYLIYGHLMNRPQPFTKYFARRIQRIYPTFIAVFIAYLLLSYLFPAENKIPKNMLDGTLYVLQNLLLLPGIFPVEPMISVAWTLSYEMFYYLLIPGVISLLKLRDRTSGFRASFFAFIAAAIIIYCAFFDGHVRLSMFIAGILLFEALTSRKVGPPGNYAGIFALFFAFGCTLIPIFGPPGYAGKTFLVFVGYFFMCLSCFSLKQGALATAFGWTPLRWLGNMSYSYYLLHGLTLKATFHFMPYLHPAAKASAMFFWLLLPFAFVATLLASAALYLLVERPISLNSAALRT